MPKCYPRIYIKPKITRRGCGIPQDSAGCRKEPIGRFRDAYRALRGQDANRLHYLKLTAQIRAEWAEILMAIDSTLEKLYAWDARDRKRKQREKRAESASADDRGATPAAQSPTLAKSTSRKQLLRQRVAAMRGTTPGRNARGSPQIEEEVNP